MSATDRIARADDIVLDWNQIATEVLVTNTTFQNPGMASRTLAMLNLAMYDAVNGIHPVHEQFYSHSAPAPGASVEAAAIASAHKVLSGIYTSDANVLSLIDTRRDNALALIPDSQAKTDGIAYGMSVGINVVDQRASDGFNASSQYMPTDPPEAGKWQPDPLNPGQEAWGPAWGQMTPFAIGSTANIPVPAPPALDSPAYTQAYNEVKDLGRKTGSSRTAEQTHTGLFWAYDREGMGTPMTLYNDIARKVAQDQGNDMQTNAYYFAKTFTAVADAGIVAWDSKFEYDLWRPVTGIREGDHDGNPLTAGESDWTPLGAPGDADQGINDFTPPFPTYLSGHATFGGALFEMLQMLYGGDLSFTITSAELSGPEATRTYTFSEAMADNGLSRVFLGIHWNFDDLVGRAAGQAVAQHITWESGKFALVPEPTTATLALLGGALLLRRRVVRR